MSQNYQNPFRLPNRNLPVHILEQIIETQKQQLELKTQGLKIKEKEMEFNTRLAEKQMTIKSEILKNKPIEFRKNVQTIAILSILFFSLFLFFFAFCIQSGHESFALKIFGYLMYGITTIGGYWAGRRVASNHAKMGEDVQATELSEEKI